jgi:hypothetical protein
MLLASNYTSSHSGSQLLHYNYEIIIHLGSYFTTVTHSISQLPYLSLIHFFSYYTTTNHSVSLFPREDPG